MCGIFAILGLKQRDDDLKRLAIRQSKKMKHRGPDWSGYFMDDTVILCHERLSIIDVFNGAQPIISIDGNIVLTVNGEIYNYRELKRDFDENEFKTNSDCEIIIHLYRRYGKHFMDKNLLQGMFAFVLYDKETNTTVIARDHLGIMPLYIGYDLQEQLVISSEMKALVDIAVKFKNFPIGQYFVNDEFHEYYKPKWKYNMGMDELDCDKLKNTLVNAVISHMISDVPFGVLLSGGLDSSLIASIAARNYQNSKQQLNQLHSFCIGLKGSPDLKAAEEVANFIKTKHYSFEYTVQEGIDALEDVIYHIESCDITTVRASTPMYLLARRIRAMGIKFVLTGEVSDEISGSYAYFKYAPNQDEFYQETLRKINDLHRYDLLRANKSLMAWSIEGRLPFGDQSVTDIIMNIHPKYKMWNDQFIEKTYLRTAFDDQQDPYLPHSILWRKKEQFSDGVGYNWIDELKKYADHNITDQEMSNVSINFPIHTPRTKEELLYRKIFDKHFKHTDSIQSLPYENSVACSTGYAINWMSNQQEIDPSGRSVI